MNENITRDNTDYKTVLERDGIIAQIPFGFSMLPMLREKKDAVIVKKIEEKPRENDVVLYRRDSGKYVLHRVIKVRKDGYVIRGDNCLFNEYDIKDRHIIGVLSGFYRKEKYVDCTSNKAYKAYVAFWRGTYYVRFVYMAIREVLRKIRRTASALFKKEK